MPDTLYVAAYGKWWRLFAMATAAGFLWLLAARDAPSGQLAVVAAWQREGLIIRAGVVLLFVVIPGLLLDTFFKVIVFRADVIRRRNMFGRWHQYRYSDIEQGAVWPDGEVEIRFVEQRKLTIYPSQAEAERVEAILRDRIPQAGYGPARGAR